MAKSSFFRRFIRKSFFDESKLAAETRTKLKLKNIFKAFVVLLVIVIIVILCYTPSDGNRKIAPGNVPDYTKPQGIASQQLAANEGAKSGHASTFGGGGIGYGTSYGSMGSSAGASRNRNANQVIRRGQNGNDPGAQIPIGTMIGARLLNQIHSGSTGSPVIAEITSEAVNENGTSIPVRTKIIGTGAFDPGGRRIQIHFSTLVYEDGSQHSVQAQAMMGDGSSGLQGDYRSGQGEQRLGKFIGNFVSGLADGMKERTAGGILGGSVEPGSVKNGLLNGVALSAEDQAKYYSEDLTNEKPSMSVTAGTPFFLFLEKEYVP